jgi:hypothetical protein
MAGVEISGFLACFFGDSGAKDSMCLCIRQLSREYFSTHIVIHAKGLRNFDVPLPHYAVFLHHSLTCRKRLLSEAYI